MEQVPKNKFNRIDYIVQENPNGVFETLLAEGIQPSTDIRKLIDQTKLWIQKEGKDAVIKLLKVHPEKNAIISANTPEHDNFGGCGCKSSFNGSSCGCKSSFDGTGCSCQSKSSFSEDTTKQKILKGLSVLGEKELILHYKDLKRLLEKFPNDQELRSEVEVTWEYLKSHNELDETSKVIPYNSKDNREKETDGDTVFSVSSKDLAIGSFIFGIALIISQIR